MRDTARIKLHRFLRVILCLAVHPVSALQYGGRIDVTNAGLLNVYQHDQGSALTLYSILVATYDTRVSTYDTSFVLKHPGLDSSSNYTGYTLNILYNVLHWPKQVQQVPSYVFNFDAVVHADGALIVSKDIRQHLHQGRDRLRLPGNYSDIIDPLISTGHIYSDVTWLQADALGSRDIVTCRVLIQSDTVIEAQLVWLEHPILDPMTHRWDVRILKESVCDINVAQTRLNVGLLENYDVIYATGYYTHRLTFFWTTNLFENWSDPSDIEARVIAQGCQFYDVQLFDINYDSNVDLLVTSVDNNNGTVEVWEIPEDFRESQNYIQHVIASGFAARNGGVDGRSPGVARPFYPTANTQSKPWILVTGADDGRVYYLSPVSEDRNTWQYSMVTIGDYGPFQTVSGATTADVDGDGYTDAFISVHSGNFVDVYSFKP